MGCGGSKTAAVADEKNNSPKKEQQQQSQNSNSPAKTSPKSQQSKTTANRDAKTDGNRDKYVVSDSATQSARSDTAFSEATDKGFKRKIREKLREATAGSDIEELEKAMDRFTRQKLDDCGDFSRALDRLEYLRLRRDLRDAVRRSHVGVLKKTIEEAENSQFSGQLHNQIEAARRKLQHLMELNEYKHDILTMEQSTISEIHSYQRPPLCVHDVMVATYMLLGHQEPRLTEWADIQTLLCRVGRDSLIHDIRDFDSAHVDPRTSRRVQEILQPHELHTIRQASNGAATFYVWTTQICDKVERDSSQTNQGGQEEQDASTARTEDVDDDSNDRGNTPRKKHQG
ncbi:uncharacterized protein LOC143297271 [Babylonia areolata]|uniref:uncharacterized protein LOC143297271 n=1 Tax=Babylonia areolata TaxID=304850 RepID=UPI003FD15886